MTRPLRDAFGLRGPLLGGPLLLFRALWLVPLAFLVELPFEVLGRGVSCAAGVCHDPNSTGRILENARTLRSAPDGLWVEVWTRTLRAVLLVPPQLVVSAVTMAVLARVCVGHRIGVRGLLRHLRGSATKLITLGAIFFCAPPVLLVVPSAFLQRQLAAVVAGDDSPGTLLAGVLLSLLVMFGGLCSMLAAVLGYLAVAPVLLERVGALTAVARVARLAVVRTLVTFVTTMLVLSLPTLVDALLSASAGTGGTWITLTLRKSAAAALSLPLVAAMYFVRYLDLRRRRDGYDRDRLATDVTRGNAPC